MGRLALQSLQCSAMKFALMQASAATAIQIVALPGSKTRRNGSLCAHEVLRFLFRQGPNRVDEGEM